LSHDKGSSPAKDSLRAVAFLPVLASNSRAYRGWF
jgi:hypothetical protein